MSTDPIIPHPSPSGITSAPPALRYHQIRPLVLHTGARLAIADGVVEVAGFPYLGQVRRERDTGAFTVAAFVDAYGYGWRAPLGWQADILLSMTDERGGDDPPPPPAGARPVGPAPWDWIAETQIRRALAALPLPGEVAA